MRFQGQPFGAMRPPERLNAAQHFTGEKDERVRPAFLPRQYQQIRILAAEARDAVLILGHANNGFVLRTDKRVEDGRVSAGNEFDDEKVVAGGAGGLPYVACREGDFGNAAFDLPAGHHAAAKFRIVGNEQNARRSQAVFRSVLSLSHG